ncbi:hypothetical protein AK812_SmicGene19222 [Symbiodinium microadriaticum]|uniref:Uncharacterized protein n=1 Tax=Symbiodinium microadriaticum TaxID=2951 RepID=A0A1Q9DT46_SYMMI|nr:hypothetical protein AK812_SmicGene19222 [Symbiodinium microadriaticum]
MATKETASKWQRGVATGQGALSRRSNRFAYWKDAAEKLLTLVLRQRRKQSIVEAAPLHPPLNLYGRQRWLPYARGSDGLVFEAWQPVCTQFATDAIGDSGWSDACPGGCVEQLYWYVLVPVNGAGKKVPAGAAYLKLDMGEVVGYSDAEIPNLLLGDSNIP